MSDHKEGMRYKAFLSYSHAADGKLAPALQSGLHRFAKPWYQLRALRIFRDKGSLSANPALWPSIERALSESEYFLLLASPEAAQSFWVKRELHWWLENRTVEKLLILHTDGELRWDRSIADFDWSKTTALPNSLRGRFQEEPYYVDLRWARTEENLSLRHSQFRGTILDIAAPLHEQPKDELDGDDVRGHSSAVRSAAFSSDGQYIVTASNDQTARVYSFLVWGRLEDILTLAREYTTRQLTAEEREKYLHEPQHK